MDRADVGGWIGGPATAGRYRGQRLGLPPSGPGSMASTAARVLALLVDWIAALALSRLIAPPATASLLTLGIFFVEVAVLTWLSAASFGQRIVGIRVVGRTRRLGLAASALRALLICLAIPPLIWDADGRGLHDRAVDSLVLRT